MENKPNNINEYYSTVDKSLLGKLCENQSLKNLIELSTQTDLFIFDKKNQQWSLKSKNKLKKECEQIKKKELKNTSSMLSNLAKLSNIQKPCDKILDDNTTNEVKKICKNLESRIINLDKILNELENINSSDPFERIIDNGSNKKNISAYIECYSNC